MVAEFPIEIMLSPLESAEGILVTAAIRNISARKAAEEHLAKMEGRRRLVEDSLRESEERYRMLLDGIQNYAIFMMDPRGQILSWNAGAERIKGYTADEIIGTTFPASFLPKISSGAGRRRCSEPDRRKRPARRTRHARAERRLTIPGESHLHGIARPGRKSAGIF
jgi:PAS domain S-box-containing protein